MLHTRWIPRFLIRNCILFWISWNFNISQNVYPLHASVRGGTLMEEVDGKRRIREFYAMTPEDAYSILEAIAEINNYSHRLKKWKATVNEQKDEALAQEINEQHQERMAPFTFSACNIAVGEQIEFYCVGNGNTGAICEVVDDKHVAYNGETWSLTALAKHLVGTKKPLAGPRYFKYKGEWLNTIRHRQGE